MNVAIVLILFFALAGWPLLAFVHYHLRQGRTISQSLSLMAAPGFCAFFVAFLTSDGVLLPRHPGPLAGALMAIFAAFFFGLPYSILVGWTVAACRRLPRHPAASEPPY